jgi:hypothetical protein
LVALFQLRKIDEANKRKITICKKLSKKLNLCYFDNLSGELSKAVCTNFKINLKNKDIFEIAQKCKKKGLLLRCTWPAFQELWNEQNTENVQMIRDNLLLLTINPLLTDEEIDMASKIILEVLAEVDYEHNDI